MNPLANKYDVGCIVGRFQVPELSAAHKHLINTVRESHKQYIVAVGVSPTLGTKQHPLGYTTRMRMIQQQWPDAIVTHIMDTHNDEQWSRQLDLLVRALCPIGTVCMYGGRDSFIRQYTGSFDTFELGISDSISGTNIREDTGKTMLDTVDFRRGIIWACQNQYPKVYPTVDIAVWRPNETGKSTKRMMLGEVLMARRTQDDLLQFPGGFVDPTDEFLESAACRELSEELDVSATDFTYVGSCRINDWRYTGTERIHTSLFKATYEFGSGKPIDEFHSSQWVQVRPESLELVKDGHKPLFDLLLRSQNG